MTNETGSAPRDARFSRRQVFKYSGVAAAAVGGASLLEACGGDAAAEAAAAAGGILVHGATGGSSQGHPGRPPSGDQRRHRAHASTSTSRCSTGTTTTRPVRPSPSPWSPPPTPRRGRSSSARASPSTTARTSRPRTCCSPSTAWPARSRRPPVSRWRRSSTSTPPRRSTPRRSSSSSRRPTPCSTTSSPSTPWASSRPTTTRRTRSAPAPSSTSRSRPGKNSVFVKYDDYWGDKAKVDEVHIQDFADPSAQVNALQAGQVQTIDNLPYNLIDTVKGQGGQIIEAESGAWVPFTMRVDTKPFSDVRVRQAMRLICDRQQMIDNALSGKGRLGNDLYAPFDPAYAKDLPQREQDIDQAKSLLKAAGQEGLQVQLFTGDDIGSVAPASAALFVEQAKKAGVDVKVVKKNPFYGDDYLSYPFAQDFWNTRNYLPAGGRGCAQGRHLQRDPLGQGAELPEVRRPDRGGRSGRSTRPSATRSSRTPRRSSTTRAVTSSGASAPRSTPCRRRCRASSPASSSRWATTTSRPSRSRADPWPSTPPSRTPSRRSRHRRGDTVLQRGCRGSHGGSGWPCSRCGWSRSWSSSPPRRSVTRSAPSSARTTTPTRPASPS